VQAPRQKGLVVRLEGNLNDESYRPIRAHVTMTRSNAKKTDRRQKHNPNKSRMITYERTGGMSRQCLLRIPTSLTILSLPIQHPTVRNERAEHLFGAPCIPCTLRLNLDIPSFPSRSKLAQRPPRDSPVADLALLLLLSYLVPWEG